MSSKLLIKQNNYVKLLERNKTKMKWKSIKKCLRNVKNFIDVPKGDLALQRHSTKFSISPRIWYFSKYVEH